MILELLELLGVLALGVSWESWSRYLKHKEKVEGIRRSREGEVLESLHALETRLVETEAAVEASIEKNRAILKGFIDSMTDLVKISEEDKQALQNRLVASKLGKKI